MTVNRLFNNPFKFITLNTLIFICFEFLFTTFLTNQLSLPVERKSIILSALTAALIAGLYPPRKIIFLWIPPLLAITSITVKSISGESLSPADCYQYIGLFMGIYGIITFIYQWISKPSIRKIYLPVTFFLYLIPTILIWFYYSVSGNWPHPDTLMALLQTNSNEAWSYFKDHTSIVSMFSILVSILFFILFVRSFYKQILPSIIKQRKNKYFYIGCCLIALSSGYLIVHNIKQNPLGQLFAGTVRYMNRYNAFAENKKKRASMINQNLSLSENNEKGIYVLVIGESQNRLHMSVYGYGRETTPWLNQQHNENPDFLLFTQAYSCHTHTVPTLTYALTAKNQYNEISLENAVSIIEMAKAAGYHTAWISNQVQYSAWDTPITVIASEAEQQIWLNKNVGETTKTNFYDEKVVNGLQNIKKYDKMLIVIHLMGNHGSYADRYPHQFAKFQGRGKQIDAYDNSILYNDYVVSKIYDSASKLPYFQSLIYFSDHTDAVDQGLAHDSGNFVYPMTYIPMYMFFSPDYKAEHETTFNNLKFHQAAVFTNDLIFNTILGVMNIKFPPIYEEKNDFTSNKYDDTPTRFKTLYGAKVIQPYPNNNA